MARNRTGAASASVESCDALDSLATPALLALWRSQFGTPPPPRTRRSLLIDCLAYRLQEQRHGGLSAAVVRQLHKVADSVQAGRTPAVPDTPGIKPGTRLIRSWQGQQHEVTVIDGGFAYRGERYTNLSEIARRITGSRWSGPLFFGVKGKRVSLDRPAPPGVRHGR